MPTDDPSAITIRPTAAGVKRTAPLVVIFAEQLQHRRRVELALAGREATISTGCWQEFELALAAVGPTIAVIVWPHADAALWRLRRLKDRCPTRSVILITGRDADNARALRGAPVNQLIWLSEIERALWPAVRAGSVADALERVAQAVEDVLPPGSLLCSALRQACRAEQPFRSVGELAAACGCDRRTLWRHWHLRLAHRIVLRLEDVLAWVLLLHAVGRKVPGQSWSRVAVDLQVHPHTLSRAAHRLAGRQLRTLAALDQLALAGEFDARLLAAVAYPGAPDASGPAPAPRRMGAVTASLFPTRDAPCGESATAEYSYS